MRTSYFGFCRHLANPVSISWKAPDWYTGPEYRVLAPTYQILMAYKRGDIDEAGYTEAYNDVVLRPLDPGVIAQHIADTWGFTATLLCYEKSGEFCHRRLVAEWFERELGLMVPELVLKQNS